LGGDDDDAAATTEDGAVVTTTPSLGVLRFLVGVVFMMLELQHGGGRAPTAHETLSGVLLGIWVLAKQKICKENTSFRQKS
jgi:hypothetical protein